MSSILIRLSSELKRRLEQHPNHRYGNCNEYYCSILQRWVESSQYQKDLAESRITRLQHENAWLKKQVQHKEATADMFKRLWTGAIRKPAPPPSGPVAAAAEHEKAPDAA